MWVFTLRRASGSAVSCNLRSWGALGLGLLTACQRGGVSETKRSFFSWIISAQLKKKGALGSGFITQQGGGVQLLWNR